MFPAFGKCLCGEVTVRVDKPPAIMARCHCRDCQRTSGTGHATNALFADIDVDLRGPVASFTVQADSGNDISRSFCLTCGSRLFNTTAKRPGFVAVAAGLFEDSSWFEPQLALFLRTRPDWDRDRTDIPMFEAAPSRE